MDLNAKRIFWSGCGLLSVGIVLTMLLDLNMLSLAQSLTVDSLDLVGASAYVVKQVTFHLGIGLIAVAPLARMLEKMR
ncbi:hypothetical protein BH09ACT6_BH09ACT6_15690 [soil metagenome]